LVYGGAFNPPHLGHERILQAGIDFIHPDAALVLPSCISPHKQVSGVPLGIRALMCRVFEKIDPCVRISLLERAGRHDKSYTLKTLIRLKKIYKDTELFLLIGSDMLVTFEEWHRFRRILPLATLIAASRTGDDHMALERECARLKRMRGRVLLLDYDPLPMSSSEIRRIYSEGKDAREMLDPYVADIIDKFGLYR
ncbi:MAG: nicotinate (nicotinamide) nucleotide adenylyltransferase, partial [Oscillospiraceae bacterium]